MNFPKTPGQCRYVLALRSNKPIIVGSGPAGSGKTMLACQLAIERINSVSRGKVILTRPIVAADEDMGYLPGDMDQKMEPWTKPMYDIFEKYLSHSQMDRHICIEPLGYMRGRTFENTLIIADEMQNSTPNQMKNSKLDDRARSNSRCDYYDFVTHFMCDIQQLDHRNI